jgi:hypothetical protein
MLTIEEARQVLGLRRRRPRSDRHDENEDNCGGHQTKAEEAVFARGQIAFITSSRIQGTIILLSGVAKITQSENLRRTASRTKKSFQLI